MDPNTFAQLQANAERSYRPTRSTAPKQEKKKKNGGVKGFLSSLISEGGATAGALGGAAAGTAILPGVGTVIGAGLGGFLGGTGGRVVENKVRDNRIGIGDALKEGAISGVASAGPIKLLKGAAGAIRGATKGATAGEEVLRKTVPTSVATVRDTSKATSNAAKRENTLVNPLDKTDVKANALTNELVQLPGKSRTQNAIEGANDAINTSFLSKYTNKVGKRLTEEGSGLKADKNVGGVAKLDEQAGFMSRYTGTPRKQRQLMETDMKDLSRQVDDVLKATPIKVDGAQVGARLKTAMEDLTDERFIDIDLNNPSVAKIIERYSEKFAKRQDAKGVNDIIKTLNKTATRAQEKLVDPKAGVLTAQEQAALALKRAGDDVLSQIPEIAPYKKGMAQIFEVTPQVAKAGEKGVGLPFIHGVNIKTPVQATKGIASKTGAVLQNAGASTTPGATGFASRILAGRVLDQDMPQPEVGEGAAAPDEESSDLADEYARDPTNPKFLGVDPAQFGYPTDNTVQEQANSSPFAPENIKASVEKIIAQGGSQKDVREFLDNAKVMNDIAASAAPSEKGLNSTASGVIADTKTGLSQLQKLSTDIAESSANNPGVGFLRSKNPFDTNAQNLQSSIATAKQIVGKALEGGVLRKEDEVKYTKILPTLNDTDAVAQHKIQQLVGLISGRLNEYQTNISGGSGGTDLAGLGL